MRPKTPRILHSALMSTFEPGVYQQMAWESSSAQREDLNWNTRIFTALDRSHDPAELFVTPKENLGTSKLAQWVNLRRSYYRWLEEESSGYDVVLVRHSLYDPWRHGSLARIQATTGSVHHTLEIPELETHGRSVKSGVIQFLERHYGPKSIRNADVIVGVTSEIADYERHRAILDKPTYTYPNGVDLAQEPTAKDSRSHEVPEFIFMSGTFYPWQGLDLLLNDLIATKGQFVLHVVGDVSDQTRIPHSHDDRIRFHGRLKRNEISDILNRSWVGIAPLALDRKGMQEACPLKTRDYLAHGVPVYAGHADVFDHDFPFFRQGTPSTSSIVNFARDVRSASRHEVRLQATPYIDKAHIMKTFARDIATVTCASPGFDEDKNARP